MALSRASRSPTWALIASRQLKAEKRRLERRKLEGERRKLEAERRRVEEENRRLARLQREQEARSKREAAERRRRERERPKVAVGLYRGPIQKVKFFLDWIPYGKHSSFYAGVKYGIFKKYGLDVAIQPGRGSGLAVKTIGTKGADYGHADMGTLIMGKGNYPGLKVKEIAMLHHNNLFNIVFLKSSGIKVPKDLEGRKIGSSTSNSAKVVFPAFAGAAGFDPKKITWVTMESRAQDPSLFAGRVDAVPSYRTRNPSLYKMAKKLGKPIGMFNYSDFGVDIYSNGIIGHEDTLRDKPNRTRRFVVASLEAFQWSVANPAKAVWAFIEKHPHVSRYMARGHWEISVDVAITKETMMSGFGFMNRDKVQRTIDTMVKYKGLKWKPAPEEIFTNKFVPKYFFLNRP